MLLRESSEAIGESAELGATVADGAGEGGVPHGGLLARFAEAVTRASEDADPLRGQLIEAIGADAFVEAAATIGIFNGLVRVADATGIPLDRGTLNASVGFRADLGLNEFSGAQSTPIASADESNVSGEPTKLFGF